MSRPALSWLPALGVAARRGFGRVTPEPFAIAVALSAVPCELVTRTQYCVVAVSAGVVNDGALVPTGVEVSPEAPAYHW